MKKQEFLATLKLIHLYQERIKERSYDKKILIKIKTNNEIIKENNLLNFVVIINNKTIVNENLNDAYDIYKNAQYRSIAIFHGTEENRKLLPIKDIKEISVGYES